MLPGSTQEFENREGDQPTWVRPSIDVLKNQQPFAAPAPNQGISPAIIAQLIASLQQDGAGGSVPMPAFPGGDQAVPFFMAFYNVGTASQKVAELRPNRKYLLVQNNGVNPIYVVTGSASSLGIGVKIPGGGNWEPFKIPLNDIFVFATAANTAVTVVEGY